VDFLHQAASSVLLCSSRVDDYCFRTSPKEAKSNASVLLPSMQPRRCEPHSRLWCVPSAPSYLHHLSSFSDWCPLLLASKLAEFGGVCAKICLRGFHHAQKGHRMLPLLENDSRKETPRARQKSPVTSLQVTQQYSQNSI
jgi:hypothetical protein